MSVYHINKRELPFVQVDKGFIMDKALSFKAKGILLYLLSRPDDWKVYESEIATHCADGIRSVRSGIKELIETGYIVRNKVRDSKNRFTGYEYEVYEQSTKPVNNPVITFCVNGKCNTTNNDNTKSEEMSGKYYRYIGEGKTQCAVEISEKEYKGMKIVN